MEDTSTCPGCVVNTSALATRSRLDIVNEVYTMNRGHTVRMDLVSKALVFELFVMRKKRFHSICVTVDSRSSGKNARFIYITPNCYIIHA